MVNDYGVEGYGMYWVLIERLYESRDNKIEKFPKLFFGLATELCVSPDRAEKFVLSLINEYRLLKEDETHIWSDSVLRRMEIREQQRLMKVEAGRIGGFYSGITRKRKQNEALLQRNEANEAKKSKEKERKGNNNTPQEVYDYYSKTIKPGAREDAIKNIDRLLRSGLVKENLIGRINAYKIKLTKTQTEQQYYIQANNFFGKAARYKDFEPIVIKPPLEPTRDPECHICDIKGKIKEGPQKGGTCICVKLRPKKEE
jgi:hypothetical protein